MKTTTNTLRKTLPAALALFAVLSGCTQDRIPSFPDGQGENLYEIATLSGAEVKIETGAVGDVADSENPKHVPVQAAEGPEALVPMFHNLAISAKPHETYTVRFELSAEAVTAYRVVMDASELSAIDFALKKESKHGEKLVPIFIYPVSNFGTLVRSKNDLNEETSTLRLEETEFGSATHVEVSILSKNRKQFVFASQEDEETIFAKEALMSADIVATLEKDAAATDKDGKTGAFVQAPDALRTMFTDMKLKGRPGQSYKIRLILEKKRLEAYKVVADASELDHIEKKLILKRTSANEPTLVRIFDFPIQEAGRIVRNRDEKGIETSVLKLKQTEFDAATHVRVDALSKNRRDAKGDAEEMEEIFEMSEIDGKIFAREQLEKLLKLQITSSEKNFGELYFAKVEMGRLILKRLISKSELPEDSLILKKLDVKGSDVATCPKEVQAELKSSGRDIQDCVAYESLTAPILVGNLELAKDADGKPTSHVIFKSEPKDLKNADHVKIGKGTQITEKNNGADGGFEVEPSRTLRVSEINGEFLLRRTMQDSPNSFDYTFPGQSGELEIVNFVREEKGIRIVRADALKPVKGKSSTDVETLMYIPAAYLRVEKTDAGGNPLVSPRYVQTSHTDNRDNVIAYVDWTRNQIPNVSSPLNYYQLEACFVRTGVQTISKVDQRMSGELGVLNFTLSTTYAGNPSMDCAGIYQAGWWDRVQANFTFDERISFRRYVKGGDEKPLLDIPYNAQRRMGFGLFTWNKNEPNANGNTGTDGTLISLPAVWDIKNGKTIDYILAGLPQNSEQREAVIQATREVVIDLNNAFKKAFKGTPMARSGDVVTLKVEGVDIEKNQVGELGDLDKNFIYYIEKPTGSGVIGLGGNHSNPRSGRVEAGSVFQYGGNILSYVEYLRKMEKSKREYHEIMDQVEPLPAPAGGAAPPKGVSGFSRAGAANVGEMEGRFIEMLAKLDPKLVSTMVGANGIPSSLSQQLQQAGKMSKDNPRVQRVTDKMMGELVKGMRPDQVAVFEAIAKGFESGIARNPEQLELLIVESQIKHMKAMLSSEQMSRLKANSAHRKAVHQLHERMEKAGICVHTASDTTLTGMKNIEEMSDTELLVAVYKPTLAHEIGHNLGLRHNFIASFDKRNWLFDGEEKSTRDYSSVMDYLANDHGTYDGYGPQDVAALRAAYTSFVELDLSHKNAQELVKLGTVKLADGSVVKVADGKYIHTSDYLKLLGLKSWLNFNYNEMARLPLRDYSFCTDEDVLYTPTCNRFDSGTTPQEVVQNIARNYREMYSYRNFAHDKLNFSYWDTGAYIGRLFGMMLPARQFLEETFYLAITLPEFQGKSELINSYAGAAVQSLLLFQQVVRTPDISASSSDEARFVKYRTDKNVVTVERKWLESVGIDGADDRLRVRGIEFDKVIATILLTERALGMPRYERASLRISFPQFENLVGVKVDPNAPDGAITLNLLRSMMTDTVTPMAATADGGSVFLSDGRFKSSVNEMMRIYAAIGSMVSLDIDSTEASQNLSALYRVFGGKNGPKEKGVTAVNQNGASQPVPGELQFWAYDQNYSAKTMIGQISDLDKLLSKKTELSEEVKKWFVALLAAQAAKADKDGKKAQDIATDDGMPEIPNARDPEKEMKDAEKAIDQILAAQSDTIGPKKFSEIVPTLIQIVNLAAQVSRDPKVTPEALESIRTQIETIIKSRPVLGVMLEAVPAQELGLEKVLPMLVTAGVPENQRGTAFRNASLLHDIFSSIHEKLAGE